MSEDVVVPKRAIKEIDSVNGNLIVNEATIKPSNLEKMITVSGDTRCHGDCTIEGTLKTYYLFVDGGDLEVKGNLHVERKIRVKKGRLRVDGNVISPKVEVDKSARILGDLKAEETQVGGTLIVGGSGISDYVSVGGTFESTSFEFSRISVGGTYKASGPLTGKKISVGGTFKAEENVSVEEVDVGGTIKIQGDVISNQVNAGGTIEIQGGEVKGRLDAGGTIRSRGYLIFDKLDAGGSITIEGGSGENIDVGGSFVSNGNLKFSSIDVGGTVKINGDGEGHGIDVGGTVKIRGNLTLSNSIDVGGTIEVDGALNSRSIHAGGKVRALKINATNEIETNVLRTRDGAKADRIEIGKKGEVEGPLIANRVYLRDKVEAEDIYAKHAILRRNCRVRNVYADRIQIESGSDISGKVLYTDSLEADTGVQFRVNPEKTEKLPDPPF